MTSRCPLILSLLFLTLGSLSASSIVEEGFADFRARGAEAALKTWGKSSSDPANLDEQGKFQELIRQEKLLGACLGYEIRFKCDLGSGSSLYLISSRFDKGTLFFRFLVFTDTLNRSSLTLLHWSPDPVGVWPEKVLFPDKKN